MTRHLTGTLPGATTGPAPSIQVFPADSQSATGEGMIVFPGGGYGMLSGHEGRSGYAPWFAERGVTCFAVDYRLGTDGHRHPSMLEDALAAIYTVRKEAAAFGVDPNRLGVMGASAGGHLAAHASTAYRDYAADVSLRPDFCILTYPVLHTDGSR